MSIVIENLMVDSSGDSSTFQGKLLQRRRNSTLSRAFGPRASRQACL